jgi:hypothetical protein
MSTQTSSQSFPAPCKRCGGALYQPADLCPYCGTPHPLDERPRATFGAAPAAATAGGAGSQRHPFAGAETETEDPRPQLASPDTPIPPLGHPSQGLPTSARTLLTRGLIGVVVVMLGYGAYTLFGGHSNAPTDSDEDTQSTGGSVAAYSPNNSAGTSYSGSSSNAPNGSANAPPRAGAANQATSNGTPAPAIAVQAPPAPHYRDLSESLRVARADRDANNLSGAQLAVNAAFAMQANSADAQMIQHELTPLEQRRDAAIQTALVCVKGNLWNCVEHSARDALAIDTGSLEAKALLERAIVETGWAPLHNKSAPAAPAARTAPATHAAANEAPLPPLPPLPSPAPAPAVQAPQAAQPAPAVAATPAANSVDAQERAIAEFGWKNSAASSAATASSAAAAH